MSSHDFVFCFFDVGYMFFHSDTEFPASLSNVLEIAFSGSNKVNHTLCATREVTWNLVGQTIHCRFNLLRGVNVGANFAYQSILSSIILQIWNLFLFLGNLSPFWSHILLIPTLWLIIKITSNSPQLGMHNHSDILKPAIVFKYSKQQRNLGKFDLSSF